MTEQVDEGSSFERFVANEGERLRRVLVAHYGLETGPDVAAHALVWAWEHWDEGRSMENPVGCLYDGVLAELQTRPGQWALIKILEVTGKDHVGTIRSSLRKRRIEATQRQVGNQQDGFVLHVYARWPAPTRS